MKSTARLERALRLWTDPHPRWRPARLWVTFPATAAPMLFEIQTGHTPESLTDRLRSLAGVVLLRAGGRTQVRYGDPWRLLDGLLARYELLDAIDLPFPPGGCFGYLGFHGESQLSILIRMALCHRVQVHDHTGAGIVADSDPEAEYDETLAKAAAFLQLVSGTDPHPLPQRPPAPADDAAST